VRIVVDPELCVGHAQCSSVSPKVYELDSEGYCAVSGRVVPVEDEHDARLGAAACPERAISLL
jgi:ferredoxin